MHSIQGAHWSQLPADMGTIGGEQEEDDIVLYHSRNIHPCPMCDHIHNHECDR